MERDFKGIWIPKEVWLNKDLKIIEKLFLVEIESLDNDGCWASNKYFADFFNISKGRCSQVISSLEKKNLISIEFIREDKVIKKRIIRVFNKLNRVFNNGEEGIKYSKGGYLENDKENNTITNNTNNNITTKARFKKPSIDEVKLYIEERGNIIDANRFYNYYESNGWKVGRNKMKCWKSACRGWESRAEKTQSKVAARLSSHASALNILKNIQNGN